ncbi:TrmH family RNA methyltransferase [Penaeicola halotolerans]|uniref:TrmH family RNA methyltransferase n=1 Tax=Penaeicola halotolerans TaxID=2793196 RepID=UPI001CF885F7|nr:RNA methyltransferase [Penaeicola halotolerans]
MLSKNTVKFIKSLHLKKYRRQEKAFLVEGAKSLQELLKSQYDIRFMVLTQSQADLLANELKSRRVEVIIATANQLEQISTFKSNDAGLAVVTLPEERSPKPASKGLTLCLDDVRDPGNLGTIIRIADWYGVREIVCSEETAEFYNPKVISATMGSFCRVGVSYTSLTEYLSEIKLPVYGAFLAGDNIYKSELPSDAVIVMGNESNGISDEVAALISHRLTIPSFGAAESLNVAIATAVICDNFRRGA